MDLEWSDVSELEAPCWWDTRSAHAAPDVARCAHAVPDVESSPCFLPLLAAGLESLSDLSGDNGQIFELRK